MENGTALQALADLAQIMMKLLGRPAVQRQLVAVVLSLVLAGVISRLVLAWLSRRLYDRPTLLTEEEPPLEETAVAEETEAEPVPPLSWRERGTNLALSVIRQLAYPAASLLLAYPALALFSDQGWPAGLLAEFIFILWLFLGYRFFLGLLYASLEEQKVRYYRARLLAPLFAIVIILMVLSLFTQLNALAAPLVDVENALTLDTLLFAVVGFYFWFVFTLVLLDILQAAATRRGRREPGSVQASLIIGRYVLIIAGLFAVFQMLQLDTTTVAAITGGLSIGLGFALQDVIKNFVGGIILLFEGTIRPGDWVEVDGVEGEVEKLSIRATIIRRLDSVRIIVPNQEWLISKVTTYTHRGRRALIKVAIGVSYESNVQQVREALIDTIGRHPEIINDPAPFAVLTNFGDSSLDIIAGGWVEDASTRLRIANELRLMIWDAFAEHGIQIPFPQRDIHIRSDRLPEAILDLQELEEGEVEPVRGRS